MKLVPRRFAATASDALVGFWANLRRRRRIDPGPAPVKVNVGSGLVVAPGWINLDVSLITLAAAWPAPLQKLVYRLLPDSSAAARDYDFEGFRALLRDNRFVHHRVEFGLPFADDTVDFIFSSHFVEHLYESHANRFFAEAHRALRNGGVLRICVPDLEHAVRLYQEGRKREALEFFFYDVGPSDFTRHRYMYDYELLESALARAGFREIVRREFRAGRVPDLDVLDNRPEETLYVEATK